MTEKRCPDCRWYRADALGDRFAKCHAPAGRPAENVLAGIEDSKTRWGYCSIERGHGWFGARFLEQCGREGRWFEAKP